MKMNSGYDEIYSKRMALLNMLQAIEEVDEQILTLPELVRWKMLIAARNHLIEFFEANTESIYLKTLDNELL